VVIAGRANSGKSSIFNMLLNFERSIVAPGPGTTRDYVEERSVIGGCVVTLIDTAGLRRSDDPVEAEGIVRSRRQIEDADLVIIVVDGSRPIESEDLELIDALRNRNPLVVLSKNDLPAGADLSTVQRRCGDVTVFPLSALTGAGVPPLVASLAARCRDAAAAPELAVAPNLRHQDALSRAAAALEAAGGGISTSRPPLAQAAADLKAALAALDEITGETASEAILDAIFSRFCVGK
jgi:tRNA modification GTPase